MDLLGTPPKFKLHDKSWRIFSRSESDPGQYIGDGAKISDAFITEGCEIYGTVEHSVLGNGVTVAPGAIVRDSVIMENTKIGEGAIIEYSIVAADSVIGSDAKVGESREDGGKITVLGSGLKLPAGTKIDGGLMVNEKKLEELLNA